MKKFLVMMLAIASIGVASAQTVNDDVVVTISNNKFEKSINVPQSCVIAVARIIEDTLSEKDLATIYQHLGEVINSTEKTYYAKFFACRNSNKISFLEQPRAFKIPISFVLSFTDTNKTFIIPIPPTNNAIEAIPASMYVIVLIMVSIVSNKLSIENTL